jgi:phosphopantothenoylcysteine decarboxylase/phosphopantothenate--cysteine ligase
LGYARQKLARKGCDLLVLNQVGRDLVFGQDRTAVSILDNSGAEPQVAAGGKDTVARAIIERVAAELVS